MFIGRKTELAVSENDDDLGRYVDRPIGRQIRLRRKTLRRSQARLGAGLGVGARQVKMDVRSPQALSSAKQFELAQVLEAPVASFCDGLGADVDIGPRVGARLRAFWSAADAGEWNDALGAIKDPRLRGELRLLIEVMTDEP